MTFELKSCYILVQSSGDILLYYVYCTKLFLLLFKKNKHLYLHV